MGCGHCGEEHLDYEKDGHWRKYEEDGKKYCIKRWWINKNGTEVFNEGAYFGKR